MSAFLIAYTNIQLILSLLFSTIFLGEAAAIVPGLVLLVLVCEELPSPNKNASRLHIILGRQLDAENNYCIVNVLLFLTF
jgi:hypothetical protein